MLVHIPVSLGELFDKISILNIKKKEMASHPSIDEIHRELELLEEAYKPLEIGDIETIHSYIRLYETNALLWDICEKRREQELSGDFGEDFIEASRKEYMLNDQRARIKRGINQMYKSHLVEVKSYGSFDDS